MLIEYASSKSAGNLLRAASFGDGSLLFYDILGVNHSKKQDKLVPILSSKVKEIIKQVVADAKENSTVEELPENKVVVKLDLSAFVNYGNYPQPSKIIGNLHDTMVQEHEGKSVVTLGVADSFMMFRIDKLSASVGELIKSLQAKFPHGRIDGGGHDLIGSIRFYSGYKERILSEISSMITQWS